MEIKRQGQILQLDPSKEYVMFVRAGSLLAHCARSGQLKMEQGRIFLVGSLDEFMFVENSDTIVDIAIKENNL